MYLAVTGKLLSHSSCWLAYLHYMYVAVFGPLDSLIHNKNTEQFPSQVAQRLGVGRGLEVPEVECALLFLGERPQQVGVVGGGVPEAGGADGPIGVLNLGQVGAEVRIVVGLWGWDFIGPI